MLLAERQLGVQSRGHNAQLAGSLSWPRTCLLWGLQESLGAHFASPAPAGATGLGLDCVCRYSLCGTEGRPPCHVCPSPPPAGAAWFPWFKVRAKRVRRSRCESKQRRLGSPGSAPTSTTVHTAVCPGHLASGALTYLHRCLYSITHPIATLPPRA